MLYEDIKEINTNKLDINNDEILLYHDPNRMMLTDDGYCAFEFQVYDRPFSHKDPDIKEILDECQCYIGKDGALHKPTAHTPAASEIKAMTACYQRLQHRLLKK